MWIRVLNEIVREGYAEVRIVVKCGFCGGEHVFHVRDSIVRTIADVYRQLKTCGLEYMLWLSKINVWEVARWVRACRHLVDEVLRRDYAMFDVSRGGVYVCKLCGRELTSKVIDVRRHLVLEHARETARLVLDVLEDAVATGDPYEMYYTLTSMLNEQSLFSIVAKCGLAERTRKRFYKCRLCQHDVDMHWRGMLEHIIIEHADTFKDRVLRPLISKIRQIA